MEYQMRIMGARRRNVESDYDHYCISYLGTKYETKY